MPIAEAISAGMQIASFGMGSVSFLDPIKRSLGYGLNSAWPNLILDPSLQVLGFKRGFLKDQEYYTNMRNLGYDFDLAALILTLSQEMLPLQDHLTLFRRGYISKDQLYERARKLNVTKETLDDYIRVADYFPPPPDLVRFAVRDVYTPETVKLFGLDKDTPQKYLDEAAKAGLPRDMAQLYWNAHWALPSVNMGYEMLHRKIIGETELKGLMKALDIAPAWRDYLIKMSYNKLARVDIRRIDSYGLFETYDDLVDAYKAGGYSPENAELMAKFTKQYNTNEMSGITRANIGDAYLIGAISETDMYDYLLALEKSETFATFWKEYYQLKRTQKEVAEREAQITEMYLNGGIEFDDIRTMLIADGASAEYITYVLRKVQSKLDAAVKQPTKDEVLDWYAGGVISDGVFYRYMKKLHYTDETISYYLVQLNEPAKPRKRKFLSVEKYMDFFISGYIPADMLLQNLTEMGYSLDDINVLVLKALDEINKNKEGTV